MCGRYDNLIAREAYRRLFKPERLPLLSLLKPAPAEAMQCEAVTRAINDVRAEFPDPPFT